ncbi:TPA: hypothetical protein QDB21_005664 [Burkholderia vietnamiensis]|nr:hypothetical protein [Burkholderia vietnamiensis]
MKDQIKTTFKRGTEVRGRTPRGSKEIRGVCTGERTETRKGWFVTVREEGTRRLLKLRPSMLQAA